MSIDLNTVTAVILAGGRATRMAGHDKGLLPYYGKPLICHVIDRLKGQLPRIVINANRHLAAYAQLGYRVIPDLDENFAGPLAGVRAALTQVDTHWVVSVPTDAPHLPTDLVARLCRAATAARIHVTRTQDELQPVFALWPRQCLPALNQFLAAGNRAVQEFLHAQQAVGVDFSDQVEAFTNINTPQQLSTGMIAPVLCMVAWSGTGKTTLLKQVVTRLCERRLRVGIVKHAHHRFDIDIPGKDSYELRHAGAQQVLVASDQRWAMITETGPDKQVDPDLTTLLQHMDHALLDIILVEGFKHSHYPKIELHRPSLQQPLLTTTDPTIIAVASDVGVLPGVTVPLLNLNNTEQISGFIQQWLLDQTPVTSA